MKFSTNFVKHGSTHGISEGSVLNVKVDGAHFISGGIYQNGFPVVIFQTQPGDSEADIIVKRKDKSLKGTAVLKVRAYDDSWKGSGWNDTFEIF